MQRAIITIWLFTFLFFVQTFARAPEDHRTNPASERTSPPIAILSPGPTLTDKDRAWVKQLGTSATVVLYVVVDSKGKPSDVRLIRGISGDLDRNAVAAVKTWEFEPAMKNGKNVPAQINVELNLRNY